MKKEPEEGSETEPETGCQHSVGGFLNLTTYLLHNGSTSSRRKQSLSSNERWRSESESQLGETSNKFPPLDPKPSDLAMGRPKAV